MMDGANETIGTTMPYKGVTVNAGKYGRKDYTRPTGHGFASLGVAACLHTDITASRGGTTLYATHRTWFYKRINYHDRQQIQLRSWQTATTT